MLSAGEDVMSDQVNVVMKEIIEPLVLEAQEQTEVLIGVQYLYCDIVEKNSFAQFENYWRTIYQFSLSNFTLHGFDDKFLQANSYCLGVLATRVPPGVDFPLFRDAFQRLYQAVANLKPGIKNFPSQKKYFIDNSISALIKIYKHQFQDQDPSLEVFFRLLPLLPIQSDKSEAKLCLMNFAELLVQRSILEKVGDLATNKLILRTLLFSCLKEKITSPELTQASTPLVLKIKEKFNSPHELE